MVCRDEMVKRSWYHLESFGKTWLGFEPSSSTYEACMLPTMLLGQLSTVATVWEKCTFNPRHAIRNKTPCPVLIFSQSNYLIAGLGGSVGYAVRLETRRSRVQPPPRSVTFSRGDWSWNIFYGHSLPSADSRRAVVIFWQKNVHNTG